VKVVQAVELPVLLQDRYVVQSAVSRGYRAPTVLPTITTQATRGLAAKRGEAAAKAEKEEEKEATAVTGTVVTWERIHPRNPLT
jgi:hypothetical protein